MKLYVEIGILPKLAINMLHRKSDMHFQVFKSFLKNCNVVKKLKAGCKVYGRNAFNETINHKLSVNILLVLKHDFSLALR